MVLRTRNELERSDIICYKEEDSMNYEECIQLGLNGEDTLKLILCGGVEKSEEGKLGVVSVVYATNDKELARKKLQELTGNNPSDNYYMVYSVPLDTDLTKLAHYPSIAISKEDLK